MGLEQELTERTERKNPSLFLCFLLFNASAREFTIEGNRNE